MKRKEVLKTKIFSREIKAYVNSGIVVTSVTWNFVLFPVFFDLDNFGHILDILLLIVW